ncbi:MAG: EamA family transporter RarD, partial [Ruthenibacterium sp.]
MKKGPIYVFVCYALWGLLPVFWKTMSALSPFFVLAMRIVWSLGFISLILACTQGFGKLRAVLNDRHELLLLMVAAVFICINWGGFIWAVSVGRVLDSSLAYYMNPILTILIGTVFFHEKLTKLQWLSVGVTAAGLLITIVRYGEIPWIALIIGLSFTLYGAVKKNVHSDAGTSIFIETLTLAPFAL